MSATKDDCVWGGLNGAKKLFQKPHNWLMVAEKVIFLDGIGEPKARQKFDILPFALIFLDQKFSAFWSDGARCGHHENIFCIRIGRDFDGWLRSDKLDGWIFLAQVRYTSSSSSVAGNNDDLGVPVY